MKRFKRQSDLVRQAVKNVNKRQEDEHHQAEQNLLHKAGDFLQRCAMKLRLPR